MIVINRYTDNTLTQNLIETWGESLEGLTYNEQIWLLGDVVRVYAYLVFIENENTPELSETTIFAAEMLKETMQSVEVSIASKAMVLVALTDRLNDAMEWKLTAYHDCDWTREAAETWNEGLEKASNYEVAWFIYTVVHAMVNANQLPQRDALDLCSDWLDEDNITDPNELAKVAQALGEIISYTLHV